jgi:uncharacterized delta-60 repeat protein
VGYTGSFLSAGTLDAIVVRFFPDGKLDGTFGQYGVVTVDLSCGGPSDDWATAVALAPDGSIAVGGFTEAPCDVPGKANFFVLKLDEFGQPDSGFGTSGRVTTNLWEQDLLQELRFDSAGRIVAAGFSENPLNHHKFISMARYNTDGSLDTSFGAAGKQFIGNKWGSYEARGLVIQPDGKPIVAGTYYPFGGQAMLYAGRLNADATAFDTAFAWGGQFYFDFGDSSLPSGGAALVRTSSGDIVIGGTFNSHFALVGLTGAGALNPLFGY